MAKQCRYVVNAVGKGGETYYTQFDDKQELTNWITDRQEKLVMEELKIIDKNRFSLSKWLRFKI
ncbi:hypothetical protein R4Z10_12255 [Niallia sp. XMNu-256]|uniref:hypothetical protein n=1 Tax=Niallia sp. XMNu-256 TaxID=3082444 RepID=UPI0030D5F194